jgi:hypothetical protein
MRKQIQAFIRTVQAAGKAGGLSSVLRMRIQMSDFIKKQFKPQEVLFWAEFRPAHVQRISDFIRTVQAAGTAGSLSSVLRMRIQMSDFWTWWFLVLRMSKLMSDFIRKWQAAGKAGMLLFGPAYAQTNLRFLTGVRYSSTVAKRGVILSWFPVLRMCKQMSDF